MTIGGKTFVTNSDTEINVIMAPTTKGAADLLSGTIMTDNNADYELMLGATGRALANKFDSDKYCVTGKYYVVYDDEGGSDLITDLYVVIESADEAESSSEDPEPVVIPGGSNTSDITTALTESNDVTVPSPGTLGNVSVGEGKTLTVTGTVPAGTITGEGDVTVSGASVTGDLTFTGVTGEVTLDSVSVTGNTDITVAVDDVKLTGEITLGAKATLKIDGVVTLEEGASIEAAANAKIVIGNGADVSALAGMGLKFYDAEGNEIVLSPAARAAVAALTAGTYVYRVDWDNNGSLETAITGWVLDGNSVATSAIKSLNVAVIDNVEDLIKYTRDWELDNGKEDAAIVKMWVGEGFTAETADRVLKSTPYVMLRWARNDGIDAEAKVSDMTVKCGNKTFDLATNMSWAGTFKEDESDYFHNNWGGTAFLFNTSAADAGADEDAPGVAGVEKAPGTYTVTVTWNYDGDSKEVTATYTVPEAAEAE